jgi:hypothetical protein
VAVRQSVRFARQRAAVETFLRELDALLVQCEPIAGSGSMPTWQPKRGADPVSVERQYVKLQVVSARAAEALEAVGVSYEYKPRGTMTRFPRNPVLATPTLFSDPMIDVDTIQTCCYFAIGDLEHHEAEAREHEESLEGKVERFFGTPWRLLRAAFGSTSYAPLADSVGTVVTGVIGGLALAYLTHVLHW